MECCEYRIWMEYVEIVARKGGRGDVAGCDEVATQRMVGREGSVLYKV